MKVTLDLEQLLEEGKITQAEYEKFGALAARPTGSSGSRPWALQWSSSATMSSASHMRGSPSPENLSNRRLVGLVGTTTLPSSAVVYIYSGKSGTQCSANEKVII